MNPFRMGRIALACAAVLSMAACGGGGSSVTQPPPSPTNTTPATPAAPAPEPTVPPAPPAASYQAVSWSTVASLRAPRSGHTATLLPDGKVLVIGDLESTNVERYDPNTKEWTTVGQMQSRRTAHAAVLLPNGKLFIRGGYGPASGADVELYDVATNTATAGPSSPISTGGSTTTLLPDGRVLATGGRYWEMSTSTTAIYNPAANAWTYSAAMRQARLGHAAVLLPNGSVLVVGGTLPLSAEVYDPRADKWEAVTAPPVEWLSNDEVSLTLLADGRVLVVFGLLNPGNASIPNAVLYDPSSRSWTSAGRTSADHAYHTATLLADGSVLVVGGGASANSGRYLGNDVAELYKPATNTWVTLDKLPLGPRAGHTATRLGNGRVLVAGGSATLGTSITESFNLRPLAGVAEAEPR